MVSLINLTTALFLMILLTTTSLPVLPSSIGGNTPKVLKSRNSYENGKKKYENLYEKLTGMKKKIHK